MFEKIRNNIQWLTRRNDNLQDEILLPLLLLIIHLCLCICFCVITSWLFVFFVCFISFHFIFHSIFDSNMNNFVDHHHHDHHIIIQYLKCGTRLEMYVPHYPVPPGKCWKWRKEKLSISVLWLLWFQQFRKKKQTNKQESWENSRSFF